MGKRFELLVFDWDGTLMDSAAAIVTSIQESARDLGLPGIADVHVHFLPPPIMPILSFLFMSAILGYLSINRT